MIFGLAESLILSFYESGILYDFSTPGIYFPRRRRQKLYPEGPREGEVVKPTRPWNDTAGQHYAKFITNCSSPLTMILLDDSITGDNGRGKMEGNRVLDFYARRSDTMVLRGDLPGYFYPLLFFSPFPQENPDFRIEGTTYADPHCLRGLPI